MPCTDYIWDEVNDTLLAETDAAGNTIAEYTHEPGQFGPLISQRRNGQTRYHHYDGLGSTRALTDESGNVTDTYTYTAFGEPVATAGTTENPFGYKGALGYYSNLETNDFYIRARIYSPAFGRWLSQDPIEDDDNAYRYVLNAPVAFVDPTGESYTPMPMPLPPIQRPEPDRGFGPLIIPCSSYRMWSPILCPCCTCKETQWGTSFDGTLLEIMARLVNAPANVSIQFVPGPEGYSLTCPAVRDVVIVPPTKNRGARTKRERHLFVFVTNSNTCAAMAMLAHEADHIRQFLPWVSGRLRGNVTPGERKLMENMAYEKQCEVLADQNCVSDKERHAWVRKCVGNLQHQSTDPVNVGKIQSGCDNFVAKERGGWNPV
jgi:RHS repeat-associated protein